MKITAEEIQLASQLRLGGIPWVPSVGNYVLDESDLIQRGSPFQPGVYFVLNYDHFMSLAGGLDHFREVMLWLPTWEDCREVLRELGVGDADVADHLAKEDAITNGRERVSLYQLILARLGERP
ncbi:hypothetical protein [Rubripirellula tenax]|nr:hypothetical protein [Rubripirellula tenax]